MRQDICTIPISEIFEVNDGCPICRMREVVEKRIIDYIMGAAMMEPDIRIETNRLGFCERHFDQMLNSRGRLQLALMLESHIDEINNKVFDKKLFNSNNKKGESAKKITESCFVCDKIEWGFSRMIETVFRSYETDREFREMFNGQPMFCLKHYEMLMNSPNRKILKHEGSEFAQNLTRITTEYSKTLHNDIKKYCSMYDYRANGENKNWDNSRDSVGRTVAFLVGRKYDEN